MPGDDYFMSLLGSGKLKGKISRDWERRGLAGPVVILGCYKIRQPHFDALSHVMREGSSPKVKQLACVTMEIGDREVEDCVDVLDEAVRSGTFYWFSRDFAGTPKEHYETLAQEHRAWAHLGATPRDVSGDLASTEATIRELEAKHGGPDPAQWRWRAGTPCADVFEADEAKRQHEDLLAKLAVFKQFGILGEDRSRLTGSPSPSAAADHC